MGALLIEPVWNRNTAEHFEAADYTDLDAFNRTSMESKPMMHIMLKELANPFNRTSMESKLTTLLYPKTNRYPFNRTSMESKPLKAVRLGITLHTFNRTSMESKHDASEEVKAEYEHF